MFLCFEIASEMRNIHSTKGAVDLVKLQRCATIFTKISALDVFMGTIFVY